jgi:hypothetical protein
MAPCRIQDPEGSNKVVISFNTVAGAIIDVQRDTYKIVSGGRLASGTEIEEGGYHGETYGAE